MRKLSDFAQQMFMSCEELKLQIGEQYSTLTFDNEVVIAAFGNNHQERFIHDVEVFCKGANVGILLSHTWIASSKLMN